MTRSAERYLPSAAHRLGLLLVAVGVTAACIVPPTQGATVARTVADLASTRINDAFYTIGALLLVFLACKDRSRADFWRVVAVMAAVTAAAHLLKFVLGHQLHLFPRPSGGPGGFPSAHASGTCAMAYTLTERLPRGAPLWYLFAAIISWSRVEAGAHYPYQVVGGALLGLGIAYLVCRRFVMASGRSGDVRTAA